RKPPLNETLKAQSCTMVLCRPPYAGSTIGADRGADRSDPSGLGGRARDGERALGAVFSGAAGRRLRARGAGRGGACPPGRNAGGPSRPRGTLGGGGATSPSGGLSPCGRVPPSDGGKPAG